MFLMTCELPTCVFDDLGVNNLCFDDLRVDDLCFDDLRDDDLF